MTSRIDRFKLGVLIVVGVVALLLTALGLGIDLLKPDTIEYRTYFDESVHGLDLGSPVELRGVPIGEVTAITMAPDQQHVEVVESIRREEVERLTHVLGSDGQKAPSSGLELRAQVAPLGITGVKFLAIDFFDPATVPAPALPFAPPPRYIPAAPSLFKTLEDTAMKIADKLPAIADGLLATTTRIERMVASLEDDEVSKKLAVTLDQANRTLRSAEHTLGKIDRSAIPERSARTLDELQQALSRVNGVLDRVDGEDGLLSSANRAAHAMSELGRGTSRTTRELESTMRGIREAADAIRVLADTLERDPDMLLKGRAKAKAP